jgi:hypothetical protein
MAATVLEVLTGISQAIANKHDGSTDEKGEPNKIGLAREQGEDIKDPRVMDGFNVKLSGKTLIVKYHCEETLETIHKKDVHTEVSKIMKDIVTFLKKEYKRFANGELNLTNPSKVSVFVEPVSGRRVIVRGIQNFEVGNLKDSENMREPSAKKLDDTVKRFLSLGRKGKYPETKSIQEFYK